MELINSIREYLHPETPMQIVGLVGLFLWIIYAWMSRNDKTKKGYRKGFFKGLLEGFWIFILMLVTYSIHKYLFYGLLGVSLICGIASQFVGKKS